MAVERPSVEDAILLRTGRGVHGVHQFAPSEERADWEAAADDLPEADEVGIDPGAGDRPAGSLHPEPGHHLVVDERQVQLARRLAERLEELPIAGDEAALDRLDDYRGELLPVGSQEFRRVRDVVVWEDEDLLQRLL